MSKSFVQSFFPSIASYASSPERAPAFIVYLWQVALPESCEQLYYYHNDREVSTALKTTLQLQRPCLAMAAALGAYIGLNERIDESERNNAHTRNDLLLLAIGDSWSKASTFFGCMNIVALLHHCICPNNMLWFLDCAFTGVSSLSLMTTAILLWVLYLKKFEHETKMSIERYIRILEGAMKVVVAVIIHTGLSIVGGKDVELSVAAATTAVELFYFVPLAMAAIILYPITWIGIVSPRRINNASRRGPLTAILGGILLILGALAAAPICKSVSDYMPSINESTLFYDCYHLPTIIFLGCDVVFYGYGIWIHDLLTKND